jgi:5-methylcytosine-specific restriction endonuclease McrA
MEKRTLERDATTEDIASTRARENYEANQVGFESGYRKAELDSLRRFAKRHGLYDGGSRVNLVRRLDKAGIRFPSYSERVAEEEREMAFRPGKAELFDFYASPRWKRLSYDTRLRRGPACECCGARPEHGVRIVCDHIKPVRFYWHLRYDADNLQLLCEDCNLGKGSRYTTDWRSDSRSGES